MKIMQDGDDMVLQVNVNGIPDDDNALADHRHDDEFMWQCFSALHLFKAEVERTYRNSGDDQLKTVAAIDPSLLRDRLKEHLDKVADKYAPLLAEAIRDYQVLRYHEALDEDVDLTDL